MKDLGLWRLWDVGRTLPILYLINVYSVLTMFCPWPDALLTTVAPRYKDAQALCEAVYRQGAYRTDNMLLLGAVHFQLRNFSECILFNQVSICTEYSWFFVECWVTFL